MKFKLRRWKMEDLDHLVEIADNYKIAKNLMNQFPHPYTRTSGEGFIHFANTHEPQQVFAIEIEGLAEGAIGLHPQEDIFCQNAEMGYWLSEAYWRKGIMTEVINQIVQYGFDTLNISRIFARPFGSNKGSQRVLEKAGFTLEAHLKGTILKNGRLEDELIYGIRKT